jgi:UPF0176 protein
MITNIAAYLFVRIDDPQTLRATLKPLCEDLALKGTILVAPEGINLFLAGIEANIDQFLTILRTDERFSALVEKRQLSSQQSFQKMKLKLKSEIVPLGVNNIDVPGNPAPRVDAKTLKKWLDEGREVMLLDTRNRFEFEHGAFNGAVDLNIKQFRDFPAAIAKKKAEWQHKTIVSFCTGGIRCEKAAPVMRNMGFSDVYQLDGGILKYFEQCGDAHYRGDCFVFDERIDLDSQLAPVRQNAD